MNFIVLAVSVLLSASYVHANNNADITVGTYNCGFDFNVVNKNGARVSLSDSHTFILNELDQNGFIAPESKAFQCQAKDQYECKWFINLAGVTKAGSNSGLYLSVSSHIGFIYQASAPANAKVITIKIKDKNTYVFASCHRK